MLAIIAFKQGEQEKAGTLAVQVLKEDPKSAGAHLVMAGVLKAKGHELAASDHLRKARKLAMRPFEKAEMERTMAQHKQEEVQHESNRPVIQPVDFEGRAVPYIAVFPFEDSNVKTESVKLGESIAEMMITALIRTDSYKVIERTQLDKILEEQALGQTGAIDEETAVDVGKLLGVDAVVIGSVSYFKNNIEIDSRIINASNGEAVGATSGSTNDEGKIREQVNRMAEQLAESAARIPHKQDRESQKQ